MSDLRTQRRRRGLGRALKKGERGVALVEFALVLPLLLLVLFGMIDFGQAFTMWTDETHLANSAARYAAVNKGPSGAKVDVNVNAFETDIENDADTDELKDTIAVNVCLPPGSNGKIGAAIRVNVTGTHKFLKFLGNFVPQLSSDLNVELTAHSVMRIENDYSDAFIAEPTNAC